MILAVITGDYDKALDFLLVDSVPFSEKAVIDDCTSSVSNDTYSQEIQADHLSPREQVRQGQQAEETGRNNGKCKEYL